MNIDPKDFRTIDNQTRELSGEHSKVKDEKTTLTAAEALKTFGSMIKNAILWLPRKLFGSSHKVKKEGGGGRLDARIARLRKDNIKTFSIDAGSIDFSVLRDKELQQATDFKDPRIKALQMHQNLEKAKFDLQHEALGDSDICRRIIEFNKNLQELIKAGQYIVQEEAEPLLSEAKIHLEFFKFINSSDEVLKNNYFQEIFYDISEKTNYNLKTAFDLDELLSNLENVLSEMPENEKMNAITTAYRLLENVKTYTETFLQEGLDEEVVEALEGSTSEAVGPVPTEEKANKLIEVLEICLKSLDKKKIPNSEVIRDKTEELLTHIQDLRNAGELEKLDFKSHIEFSLFLRVFLGFGSLYNQIQRADDFEMSSFYIDLVMNELKVPKEELEGKIKFFVRAVVETAQTLKKEKAVPDQAADEVIKYAFEFLGTKKS